MVSIDYKYLPSGRRSYLATCRCSCGQQKIILANSLRAGRSTSCGCRRDQYDKNRGARHNRFTGYREISGAVWGKCKRGAAKRGIPFRLTLHQAWRIFEKQGRCCALSGEPLMFGNTSSKTTASLDRIDNTKGYTVRNVQWVSKPINIMRNRLPVDAFVSYCRKVAERHA